MSEQSSRVYEHINQLNKTARLEGFVKQVMSEAKTTLAEEGVEATVELLREKAPTYRKYGGQ